MKEFFLGLRNKKGRCQVRPFLRDHRLSNFHYIRFSACLQKCL